MNCMVSWGSAAMGWRAWYSRLCIYRMSSLNLALHWHGGVGHEQDRSQFGNVFSGGLLLKVLAFMKMKFLVVGCDKRSLLISHTTLLWHCVLRACKWC